jgi:hypothetical protein
MTLPAAAVHTATSRISTDSGHLTKFAFPLIFLSFQKEQYIYDNTAACATAAYFHYQANRFVKDFSGHRDNGLPAQCVSLPT